MKLGEISTTQEQFTAKVLITARWREPSLDRAPSDGNDQLSVVSQFLQIYFRFCYVLK